MRNSPHAAQQIPHTDTGFSLPPSGYPSAGRLSADLSMTAGRGRLDRWLAERLQATIAPAAVRLVLWDGTTPGLRGACAGELLVRDRRTLINLIVNPDLQFGEAYTAGRLDIRGDFATVIESLTRLSVSARLTWRERLALLMPPPNGRFASRNNIHRHYDLGNDFYALWLDPELVYTCAYYADGADTLEAAQAAKFDLVCRKLRLLPGETVVEAGCGWGGLALYMARNYGVTVRAFNISREQLAFARERAAREEMTDRVEFIEEDYRNISGRYDVFVSVGMMEHVGRRQFSALAHTVQRTLRRDTGRGLLHFIGRDRPRPLNAWIRHRIFPGAYPPALSEVVSRVLEPAQLSILDVENLRLHYVRTLQAWAARFAQAESEVRSKFGDAFWRAWRLYLAGSEAAFRVGWLQLFQIVFAPAAGRTLHWTRQQLYRPSGGSR